LLAHLAVALILFAVIHSVLIYVFDLEPGLSHGMATEVVIVLTSVAIPFTLTFLPLRREIHGVISRTTAMGSARATDVIVRLIRGELQQLVSDLQGLVGPGIEVRTELVPDWVRTRCWETMKGPYIGTALHQPRTYMRILGKYLLSHQEYLTPTDRPDQEKRRDSIRIMFTERDKLEKDKEESKEDYDKFLKWHNDNEVELKLLPLRRAKELASYYDTDGATDIACWDGELLLLWIYGAVPEEDPVRLRMTFVGEALYDKCRRFLEAVRNESEAFPDSIDPLASPERPSKPI